MSFFDRLAERFELDEFDKRHKTAFIMLGGATILIVILWFIQLQKNIVNPLYGGVNPNNLQNTTATQNNTDAELKAKDTDGDGLNDWDELNLYKTSPYLADSDSDGNSDKDEIEKGFDPNCPVGQQCTNATDFSNPALNNFLNNDITQTVTPTTTPSTSGQSQTSPSSTLTAEEKNALRQVISSTNDPAALRQFLIQAGADATYINSISDADLQKVINELLK